jgi:hypothetical protein
MNRSDRTILAATVLLLCLGGFALSGGVSARSDAGPQQTPAQPNAAGGGERTGVPVIVELFTSEGCSSCPPADAYIAKLEAIQPIPNTQIIVLEEHVDYWNSDGWIDPYSSREWTLRQQEYAATLGNKNPYTPQLVVGGQKELLGSREDLVTQAIETAAASPAAARVSVSVAASAKANNEDASVSVDQLNAGKHGDRPEVWIVVTESGLHSAVKAGENSGQDVHHASIVRVLHKVGAIDTSKASSYSGTTSVHLDPSWRRQNLHVVAFVQDRKSHQILGAAAARIG